jgi:hypothetical protein
MIQLAPRAGREIPGLRIAPLRAGRDAAVLGSLPNVPPTRLAGRIGVAAPTRRVLL